MTSPFAVFRRYQKYLLPVIALLAIMAFVFDDTIRYFGGGAGGGNTVAVKIKGGDLTYADIQAMIGRHQFANEFLRAAIAKVLNLDNAGANDENQFIRQFQFQMQARNYLFGSPELPVDQVVVSMHLWRLEAKRLGLTVDNKDVEAYIAAATMNRLSGDDFRDVLRAMSRQRPVSDVFVFDCIREQLLALRASQILLAHAAATPEQLWKAYRQLHVEQSLEVAALPVSEFARNVVDPPREELQAFFEAYKDKLPNQPPDYGPGFKLPRRIRVQYFAASYLNAEKLVPDVTDEAVQKYYDENKETDPLLEDRSLTVPDADRPIDPLVAPEGGAAEPPLAPEPIDPGTQEKPSAPTGERKPDADPKPMGDCQPASEPASDPDPDATSKTESNEKPAEKPAQASESGEKPKPKPDEKTETNPETEDAGRNPFEQGESTPGETPAAKPPRKIRPLDEALKEQIRDLILQQRTRAELARISDQCLRVLRDRAPQFLATPSVTDRNRRIYLDLNQNEQLDDGEPNVALEKPVQDATHLPPEVRQRLNEEIRRLAKRELQDQAKSLGVTFAETELVSYEEFSSLPGIGDGWEGDAALEITSSRPRIADVVFRSRSLFQPSAGRDRTGTDVYVYWRVADVPEHVPAFQDEDVEAMVLEAWRKKQAEPSAQRRGDELAGRVRNALKAGKSMAEALVAETVTGEPASLTIAVLTTPRFRWLQQGSAPTAFGQLPPPEIPRVPFLENIGEQFMRTVFDEMQPGDVGVVANQDRSIYYLVHVLDRNPSTPEGWKRMRDEFSRAGLFDGRQSPYEMIVSQQAFDIQQKQMDALRERYGLEFVNRDEE